MTPKRLRKRIEQLEARADDEEYYRALEYIHDDGR